MTSFTLDIPLVGFSYGSSPGGVENVIYDGGDGDDTLTILGDGAGATDDRFVHTPGAAADAGHVGVSTPTDTLLDLCTGTADVAVAALTTRPGAGRVVGVDFSHEMLRLGLGKVRGRGLAARIGLARGDAMRLPLADRSVDAAVISFGIRNVQGPDVALDELSRVLRPDGRLAILEFGLPTWRPFRALYLWYSNRLLPAIGRLISRHASAYDYLPESVSRFPAPEAFGHLLQAHGFPHVEIVPLAMGIVYLYVARTAGERRPTDARVV